MYRKYCFWAYRIFNYDEIGLCRMKRLIFGGCVKKIGSIPDFDQLNSIVILIKVFKYLLNLDQPHNNTKLNEQYKYFSMISYKIIETTIGLYNSCLKTTRSLDRQRALFRIATLREIVDFSRRIAELIFQSIQNVVICRVVTMQPPPRKVGIYQN